MFLRFLLPLLAALLTGCVNPPHRTTLTGAGLPSVDALVTQRAVLTVMGRQFMLTGYLATSASGGKRLVVTENLGSVLADVLVKPDGATFVMRSSRAFKPEWIRRFIAADLQCLYGDPSCADCPVIRLSPTHFLINRRFYTLDLQVVDTKLGLQPSEMFDESRKGQP